MNWLTLVLVHCAVGLASAAGLFESCNNDTDCSAIPNLQCDASKCVCAYGHRTDDGSECYAALFTTCSNSSSDCSAIPNTQCLWNRCVCALGTKTDDGQTCNPALFESCNLDSDCAAIPTNAECDGNRCVCAPGHKTDDGTTCYAALFESCDTDGDCSAISNTKCNANKCVCAPGYVTNDGATCLVDCQTGYENIDDNCYKFVADTTVSRSAAASACASDGADLFQWNSTTQLEAVRQYIKNSPVLTAQAKYWVKPTRVDINATIWNWGQGGPAINPALLVWGHAEPNNKAGDEICMNMLQLRLYKLNDARCVKKMGYICKD